MGAQLEGAGKALALDVCVWGGRGRMNGWMETAKAPPSERNFLEWGKNALWRRTETWL